MKHFSRKIAATMAAVAFSASALSAQIIDQPKNESSTGVFGKGGSSTFGQTFLAPTGFNTLQSFSFWLTNDDGLGATNSSSLLFRAYVMQWDVANGHTTGSTLYSSAVRSGPTSMSERYDFSTVSALLTPGLQYVAFLSVSGLSSSINADVATAGMETTFDGEYAGGQFVFTDTGDDLAALNSGEWDYSGGIPGYQARFHAEFTTGAVSVVPEPSTVLLMFSGLSALLFVAIKRKRV